MARTHNFIKSVTKMWKNSRWTYNYIFKLFFDTRPELEETNNLQKEKTHNFWQLYFSQKVTKEKFDTLCKNSIDETEIENSLSTDFDEFISWITPFIGKNYFNSMKIITFCRICSFEIKKTLLCEQFNSKEHKENGDYFFCERYELLWIL